jgi:hypothetical protein
VAGDNRQHIFRGSDGALWLLGTNLQAVKMDYSWILTDHDIVLYDGIKNLYWITGSENAYILTEQGLGGPVDQRPTSLACGLGIATGDAYGETIAVNIGSNTFDMGRNGQKRINVVNMNGEFTDGTVGGQCKFSSSDSWRTLSPVRCSPEGASFFRMSFVYGRLTFGATMVPSARITKFQVRYQTQDGRFIRGTTAIINSGDGDPGAA